MKRLIKRLLYAIGVTALIHRIRNRNTLTCVMLHRVLPEGKIERYLANSEWTLRTVTFEKLLVFLKRHYNIVDYQNVRNWSLHAEPLPPRALLITFDDGWRDNYDHALPLLQRYSVPAHVFVATDKIGDHYGFWQEQVDSATRASPDKIAELIAAVQSKGGKAESLREVWAWLANNEPVEQTCNKELAVLRDVLPDDRQMMTADEITDCDRASITVGAHGASHAPLTSIAPKMLEAELQRCRSKLESVLGNEIESLSFPHGANSVNVLEACQRHGFHILFDSEPALIDTRPGVTIRTRIIPRVHLSEIAIGDGSGFVPSEAAHALFFRPHKR